MQCRTLDDNQIDPEEQKAGYYNMQSKRGTDVPAKERSNTTPTDNANAMPD